MVGDYLYNGKGYGEAGASYKKRALKGFTARSGNAHDDIDMHNYTLRQRARILYMASPVATSAIRTNRTNVIGCGLKLKCRINKDILGLTQQSADEWKKHTEAEFALWADRKRACDATGVNDFYAMQQLALTSWLLSGDCFVLIKACESTLLSPYRLRLHIIEADRVSTPASYNGYIPIQLKVNGENNIYDGVEVNKSGAVIAYHINDGDSVDKLTQKEWQRVLAYGEKTGLPNVLHIMDAERPEQYRGVSYLAQVIEPLLQLRRYTESEIQAAIIESFFAVFIKSQAMDNGMPMNEAGDGISQDERDYEMGPGTLNVLNPGEEIDVLKPNRPGNGFDGFVRSMCEQVGAALEVPADLLLKAFNSSYSASRAALLEAWKAFKMRREWFVNDFCKPVYEIWLSEAVALGRIQAPGFFTDPFIRQAWLGSEWIGPSQGQLDPIKEISAELLAISEGITTREQSTVKLNSRSWDENMAQIAVENAVIANANAALNTANEQVVNTIKQTIKESVEEEQKNGKRKK